jgi:hypothetical protein
MPQETRPDDLTIRDDDRLLRRVTPNQLFTDPDGTTRPTSAVFKSTELSVNIESLMIQQKRPLEDTLANHPGEFLTSITAAAVRVHGLPIVKDNEPPNDPAHGLILGKKTGSFANAMVRAHKWVVPPPNKGS